jgi:hypothetical protein
MVAGYTKATSDNDRRDSLRALNAIQDVQRTRGQFLRQRVSLGPSVSVMRLKPSGNPTSEAA